MPSVICWFLWSLCGGIKSFNLNTGKLSPQLLWTFQNVIHRQFGRESFTTLLFHRPFAFETTWTTFSFSALSRHHSGLSQGAGLSRREDSRSDQQETLQHLGLLLHTLSSKLTKQPAVFEVVWEGALPTHLLLLLLLLLLGLVSAVWGLKGCKAVPANAVFFPIYPVLKPSVYQPTLCWLSVLNHKSPGTHFTINSMHY